MKKWSLRLLRRNLPSPAPPPEFGIRLTLRKGDKVVSRNRQGVIHIRRISEDGDTSANALHPEHGGSQVPPSEAPPP